MCHYVRVARHGLGFTTFHDHDDGDGIRICFIYFAVVLFSVLGHFCRGICLQLVTSQPVYHHVYM